MSGRNQWETVVAQATKERIEVIKIDVEDSLPVGEYEEIELMALPNTVATVLAMSVSIPAEDAGDVTGETKNLFIYYRVPPRVHVDIARVRSKATSRIRFVYNQWEGDTIDPAGNVFDIKYLSFTEDVPLCLGLRNALSVPLTKLRTYIFTVSYREITSL